MANKQHNPMDSSPKTGVVVMVISEVGKICVRILQPYAYASLISLASVQVRIFRISHHQSIVILRIVLSEPSHIVCRTRNTRSDTYSWL
jgi:hypothetical protein